MKEGHPLPDKIPRKLSVIAVWLLVVYTLAGCGGGGGGGAGFWMYDMEPDVWYPTQRIFPDIMAVDLNGDGATDIVFIEKGYYWRKVYKDFEFDNEYATFYNLIVFLQDPFTAGSFTKQPGYILAPEALSMALGDLDRDGLPDAAFSQQYFDTVRVYLQDPGNPGLFLPYRDFPAAGQPIAVALGELNGDSINDLAVAGVQLALLMNDAANPGSMFGMTSLNFPGLTSLAVADINNDNRNDLVFTSDTSVTVLFQDPAPAAPGSYSISVAYTVGFDVTEVAIADLNGDSLPDLAVANNENMTGRVSVFFQDQPGTGSFLSPVHYNTDSRAAAVTIGHLNDDVLPDMAVANDDENGGSVAVLIQDRLNPGTFHPAVLYPGILGPDDVAIGDLNQDDLADLLVADKVNIYPTYDPQRWPYVRYQDASNPGTFLEPVFPVTSY